MQKLGLTGGIGSGKSTAAGIFASLGATIIDADAIARAVTASGGDAIGSIREIFGDEFILGDGSMDRVRMRERAFSDPTTKLRLEAIVHPLVGRLTQSQLEAARQAGRKLTVLDIPLLVEAGRWRAQLDHVLVLDCLPATQVRRAMNRSALAEGQVLAIIAAQATRHERLAAADAVIFNDALSLQELHAECVAVAQRFGL